MVDRLERAGLARRERDAGDRRKIMVTATPAVAERVAPLYEPMARNAMSALAKYDEDELALLLDFLAGAREAAMAALSELRAQKPCRSPAPRKPGPRG